MRSAGAPGSLSIRAATCHINFLGVDRRRSVITHPDRPRSRDLTMFASASCPSRRRHWTSTLSCGIRTPSNFASIARFSRRQDDPQHQAGMCRSRVLGQLRVSYQDCLIFCCLISRQTISAFVGARFHSQGRPRAVQPRCAMSSFEPGLAAG